MYCVYILTVPPAQNASCEVFGYGHYVGFDDVPVDFTGECKYVAAKTIAGTNNSEFTVHVQHGVPEDTSTLFIQYVEVTVGGKRVRMGPGENIYVSYPSSTVFFSFVLSGHPI